MNDLRITRREVTYAAIMTGLTESFMIPYALALGASTVQAGLLSSCRNFILSILQLKSADAVAWSRSRKRLVTSTAWVQALCWIPLAMVAPLFGTWAVPALIALYTIGTASAAFGGPALGSMVSEYLSPEERGRFFGHLRFIAGTWTAGAALAAGLLLHFMAPTHRLVGFALLCGGAALTRAMSCRWLARMREGPFSTEPKERFSFAEFLGQVRTSNFVRFVLCVGVFNFSVNLASPYLAVYLLEELRYDYLTYTVIVQAGVVAAFVIVRRWGKVGDRSGNWVVLRWTMLGASVLPLLWPLSDQVIWLFAVYVGGGCLWGGFNLAVVNFVYDVATPAKRARCLAYFNVVNGCGASLGALTGGFLFTWLPAADGSTFASLFYCSAALRAAVALLFIRVVREVRPVGEVGLRQIVYDLVGQRVINVLGLEVTDGRPDQSTSEDRGGEK